MVSSQQVQEFFDARRQARVNPVALQKARQALLASDKAEVVAQFEARLQDPDDEQRCETIVGFESLYGPEATDGLLRWINDPSPIVRCVLCSILHESGDGRAAAALVDRLRHDVDCQVRGISANALGHMGAIEALPDLHHAHQTDFERDELGYSTSGHAEDAITSVLRTWVARQIQGTPPRTFRESTRQGQLTGTITAEAIDRSSRYGHLPRFAFGPGCATKLDLQTSLVDPFEVQVEYVDPTCVIRRILIYQRYPNSDFNWSVDTLVDPGMKSPQQV